MNRAFENAIVENDHRAINFPKKNDSFKLVQIVTWYVKTPKGFKVNQKEFVKIREGLGKSQSQLAQLLSISKRALQSYEQGWRNVPVYVERQVLFLLATKKAHNKQILPCWETITCPVEIRNNCPAWEFQIGHLCWFIGGTLCQGEVQTNGRNKLQTCRSCEVFHSIFPLLKTTTKK